MKLTLTTIFFFSILTAGHSATEVSVKLTGKQAKIFNAAVLPGHTGFPIEDTLTCSMVGTQLWINRSLEAAGGSFGSGLDIVTKKWRHPAKYECESTAFKEKLPAKQSQQIWQATIAVNIPPAITFHPKESLSPRTRKGREYQLSHDYSSGKIKMKLNCEQLECEIKLLTYEIKANPWLNEHGHKPSGGHY